MKVSIRAREVTVDELVTIRQHHPVQVEQVQEVEYIRQSCRPSIEQVLKDVPYIETHSV